MAQFSVRDLIKYDLSNPEEAAKARQEKVFEKVCANLIKAALQVFLNLKSKLCRSSAKVFLALQPIDCRVAL